MALPDKTKYVAPIPKFERQMCLGIMLKLDQTTLHDGNLAAAYAVRNESSVEAIAGSFLDVFIQRGILEGHGLRIVYHLLAALIGDGAKEDHFGERYGIVEIGTAFLDISADGGEQLLHRTAYSPFQGLCRQLPA